MMYIVTRLCNDSTVTMQLSKTKVEKTVEYSLYNYEVNGFKAIFNHVKFTISNTNKLKILKICVELLIGKTTDITEYMCGR